MPIELYNKDGFKRLMFCDLNLEGTEAVQSNQFLIVNGDTGAIIDPGGNLAYNSLLLGVTHHFAPSRLSAIIASHADPDIIASLDRWMTTTSAPVFIAKVWERFIPHFCKPGKTDGRIIAIPDPGMRIPVGDGELFALPAHFMHSEGNFQFWDPVSRILFSGDLGVSMGGNPREYITSLAPHLHRIEPFHRRYMVSNKILRLWVNMVYKLPIRMIVPQHGSPIVGPAVREFLDWANKFSCGIDLMSERDYVMPV
ncbi:MAG: MBL fold metallo-hydrolase [Leptothrix ochracea]|uniref:MBL fold metallo-hydrolase n=1 Tax=Leptothrix ochracea TaxID=735331 RepID=UPI0034E25348